MIQIIKSIINNKNGFDNINLRDFKEIRIELEIILEKSKFRGLHELIYHMYYDNELHIPKCCICNDNYTHFNNFKRKYGKTCSSSCQAKYAARKNIEYIMQYSDEDRKVYYNIQQEHRVKTLKEKYNVENPMQIQEVKEKNHIKMIKTNIESGRWLNYNKIKNDYKHYCKKVQYITGRQDLKSLENFDKRWSFWKVEDAYHLDHKFSKRHGFINNIPPYIIGSIHNLEMLTHRENCKKVDKCSISKEELFNLFFR